MRKDNASFITKFISEAGSYLVNSDYFAFVELKDYACYVIADGIDIDEKKESAKLAITTVITKFSENPGMSAGKLKQYMKAAHQTLLDEAEEIRLEVSMAILLTDYKKAMWAHAGNCRLYWLKNGSIRMATKDTSLTQKMVDDEEIPIDQLAYHEERNNLYTYLGQPGRFSPVISGKKVLEDGDILLLMTRGVWENVGEAEIIDAIDGVSKAEDVCTGLEDVILSQRMDVIENYTIATVFVNKIYKNPKAGKYKKWIKIIVSLLIVVLTLVLTLTISRVQKNKTNVEKMEKYKTRGIEYLQENNYASADEQMNEAYRTTENVKARKKSKNYTKVLCVETYEKLTDNLNRGMQALQEKEYKKAAGLFQTAVGIMEELEKDYQEEIGAYKSGIEAYLSYATSMQEGAAKYENLDYEGAIKEFIEASEIMNEIDDTANRDNANSWKNKANAGIAVQEGKKLEESANSMRVQGDYIPAKKQYELARSEYEKAVKNGDASASERVADVEKKIKDIDIIIGDMEIEVQAKIYEDLGDQAKANGNTTEATVNYKLALDMYQQAGNQEKVNEMIGKIGQIDQEASEQKEDAMDNVISAMEAIADGDMPKAKLYLEKAQKAFEEVGNKEMAKKMSNILIKLATQPQPQPQPQ
ncbi:MAG: hypothetical protein IKK33_06390 [Lachnospiraceae bacterium]|nr:hypothetical protein [Lachnospiraceae bacterium]